MVTWSEKWCHHSFGEAGPLHSLFVGRLNLIFGSSTNIMCTTGFCNALLASIYICDACIIFRGNMSVSIIKEGSVIELTAWLISNKFGPAINHRIKNAVFKDYLRPSLNRWDGSWKKDVIRGISFDRYIGNALIAQNGGVP